jgi:hypothetical protein
MSTATATATATFRTTVNGAKELKKYIEETTYIVESIRKEFEHDLKQPSAVVVSAGDDNISVGRGNHEFNAKMCKVKHDDFIYNTTQLPQTSEFIQSENVVKECLARLEGFRKMLVNNKQQKKTTIRRIRRIIADSNSHPIPEHLFEEIAYQNPIVISLAGLIEQTKQNHMTITLNILTQVRAILVEMRTRHILAFKTIAEQTIAAVIHHAEKCRVFITQCRQLAIIEYCASLWWMQTQKDPMDHECYCVSALLTRDNGHLQKFNPYTVQYPVTMFPDGLTSNVQIIVHHHNSDRTQLGICMTYPMDAELANEILTDEAIKCFEEEEMEAKRIYSQYDRPSSHYWNVDVDAETESIVWNYWGRTHDDDDDDEAAIVQCEEGEEEDGNYMV